MSTTPPNRHRHRHDGDEPTVIHGSAEAARPETATAKVSTDHRASKGAAVDDRRLEPINSVATGPAATTRTRHTTTDHGPSLEMRAMTEKDFILQHRNMASNGAAVTPGAVASPSAMSHASSPAPRRVVSPDESQTNPAKSHRRASSPGGRAPPLPSARVAQYPASNERPNGDEEAEMAHIAKVSAMMTTREAIQGLETTVLKMRSGGGQDASPTNVQAFAEHSANMKGGLYGASASDLVQDEEKGKVTWSSGDSLFASKEGPAPESGLMSPFEIQDTASDYEYGLYDQQSNGLAVAFAVEDDSIEDMFIPSAVEYDPDAKPPIYRNRRFRLYACLVIVMVLTGTIAAVVGIRTRQVKDTAPPVVPYRHTIGIRENVEKLVGSDQLNDPSNPYRKALDWIQDVDPMSLMPQDKKFKQRFLAAYLYFATSVKKPWAGACNPAQAGEKEMCQWEMLVVVDPPEYTLVPSMRWLSLADECTWAGIFCDDSGSIRSLEFSGMNMTGRFPEGVAGFSFLQSLTITYSELEGPLGNAMGDLKHLISVELTGNQLTGTIPDHWYNARSLQRINLSVNQLAGSISPMIGQLTDLKGLFLMGNKFTGPLPNELGASKSFVDFRVNDNMFSGTIPTILGAHPSLQFLWAQRNAFEGTIPTELGLCTGLMDLRLQTNSLLDGTIPEELFLLTSLAQLDLADNKLTGTLSTSIGKLSSLYALGIGNNNLGGTLPTELGMLSGMQSFTAEGNNFSGLVPTALCELVAPRDQTVSIKFLTTVQVDCAASPPDTAAEILCPVGCCTQCCDQNGENCYDVSGG